MFLYVKKKYLLIIVSFVFIIIFNKQTFAESLYEDRLSLYKKIEATTFLPWYYIAAFDQYERNIHKKDDLVAITFQKELWYGPGNVAFEGKHEIVSLFNGIGLDGNNDDEANIEDPEDILYTAAQLMLANGPSEDDIKISLWKYYERDLSVKSVMDIAKIYRHFQSIELLDRDFPVAIQYNYSYRNTWGHRRGFGGNRIHEGTDIFANYGTPVKATTYGVVELKGWNLYGGWRIGIRDIHNIYHYYAHLNSFEQAIQIGDIVQPGDILGTVGSSGYGPPGTVGKFPPHLHYGMYKDDGRNEWSFDPYPYLRKWEQIAKQKRKK